MDIYWGYQFGSNKWDTEKVCKLPDEVTLVPSISEETGNYLPTSDGFLRAGSLKIDIFTTPQIAASATASSTLNAQMRMDNTGSLFDMDANLQAEWRRTQRKDFKEKIQHHLPWPDTPQPLRYGYFKIEQDRLIPIAIKEHSAEEIEALKNNKPQ